MKKIRQFMAFAAGAVLALQSLPAASASADYCWGSTDSPYYADWETLDDRGMLRWQAGQDDYQLLYKHFTNTRDDGTTSECDVLQAIIPRHNIFSFTLTPDADADAAKEILYRYYPEQQISAIIWEDAETGDCWEVWDNSEHRGDTAYCNALMHDLAEANLISRFYSYGQTAVYEDFTHDPLGYGPESPALYGSKRNDPDAVRAYLAEKHPECTLEMTREESEWWYAFRIVSPNAQTFPEKFALAVDIFEDIGICSVFGIPASASSSLMGNDALQLQGDINIDGEVNISDAILLSRYANEDTAVSLSDIGVQKADVNADDAVNTDDVTVILRTIAKL